MFSASTVHTQVLVPLAQLATGSVGSLRANVARDAHVARRSKSKSPEATSSLPMNFSQIIYRDLNLHLLRGNLVKYCPVLLSDVNDLNRVLQPEYIELGLGLLQRNTNRYPNLTHTRGFKTVRSGRTGLTTGKHDGDQHGFMNKIRKGLFGKYATQKSSTPATTEQFQELLNRSDLGARKDELQIAYAYGSQASASRGQSDEAAQTSSKTLRRLVGLGLMGFLMYMWLRQSGAMGELRALNSLKKYEINPEEISVTFDDVKGVEEAKQELHDVVEFLRDPQRFQALGAKLPRGVLLVGPPGIGKTLLAKAVAGEAGVPYFHASGSEFDEVFVGTGAKRVRQLFSAAKARSPCVVFIDEIDTVGAKRTSSQIHPYANQTINQLLSEMDGFLHSEGIIVLGATNRRDNLDQALLRPGRFDVEVRVFPPDLKGRTEILELYLEKVKTSRDVDVKKLARGTTGTTGADLENLVNQAALKAAMDGASEVTMSHLEFALDKVFMGPAKKTKIPDKQTNVCTAYHEAGHTLVAMYTKNATPLHKVTIIPRGMSLGHTSFIPEKDTYGVSKAELQARMDVAMGGRVAEELIFGQDEVTTGAGSDFKQATSIATAMVKQYGMSEKVGVRVIEDESMDTGSNFMRVNELSPAMTEMVDSEIKRLLQESYDRARNILRTHAAQHKAIANALLKYETLDAEEVRDICAGKGIHRASAAS